MQAPCWTLDIVPGSEIQQTAKSSVPAKLKLSIACSCCLELRPNACLLQRRVLLRRAMASLLTSVLRMGHGFQRAAARAPSLGLGPMTQARRGSVLRAVFRTGVAS